MLVTKRQLPHEVKHWALTLLRETLVRIGGGIVRHGRHAVLQLAEVAVQRAPSAGILRRFEWLGPRPRRIR